MSKQILFNQVFENGSSLSVFVFDSENKNNYFYSPDEKLHKYHEITLEYRDKNKNLILDKDELVQLIGNLLFTLEELVENKHELPAWVAVGEMGHYANDEMHKSAIDDSYKSSDNIMPYWFASNKPFQTWAYNKNQEIFIEIAPGYPWHFVRPEPGEKFITFEEFMKNYKPYAVIKIDKKTALDMIEKTRKIFDEAEEEYAKVHAELEKRKLANE